MYNTYTVYIHICMYVKPVKRLWQKQFTKRRIKIRYIEEEMSTMSLNVSTSKCKCHWHWNDQQPNGSALLPEAYSRQLQADLICGNIHTFVHMKTYKHTHIWTHWSNCYLIKDTFVRYKSVCVMEMRTFMMFIDV